MPRDGTALKLDLGSERTTAHQRSREREALAENLRLLYVALTRAGTLHRRLGRASRPAESSALGYLLAPGRRRGG